MSLFNKIKKLKKPLNVGPNIFNSVRIKKNSEHLIGIDNKGLVVVLINSIKPKGVGQNLTNIIIEHDINCTIKLDDEKIIKKFTLIKCLSNQESIKELFLITLENILQTIPNEVSEKRIDELTVKLIKLFEKISNPKNIDLTGLWGELFIINFLRSTEILIQAWHSENNDLFDFFLNNIALEIKTTTKNDRKHTFKFEQLNSTSTNKIIIGSIMLKKSRIGVSLLDLKNKILKKINNLEFSQKIKEIYALTIANKSQKDLDNEKYDYQYAVDNISFYDSQNVPRIKEAPMYGVKNIKFESDLNGVKAITDFSNYEFLK